MQLTALINAESSTVYEVDSNIVFDTFFLALNIALLIVTAIVVYKIIKYIKRKESQDE